jgi:hypothetical protein
MRRSLHLAALALLCLPMFGTTSAHAQASRTWVSGVGDDVNPCSRTAPCKTFAGAISKTAVNGEINCLDPGGFGAVTITKSITIDCHEIFASILNSGTSGIIINFNSFLAGDVRKTVRIRNININGVDTGIIGIRVIGGTVAGGVVHVEDCLIDGMFGGAAAGISDERTAGGEVYVSNTTVRNSGASAISIAPATGAGQKIDAALDNVRVQNTAFGIALGNNVRAVINRSVISGVTNAGVLAAGTLAATEVNISNSVLSNNGIGVQNAGGTVTIRLADNDIAFNGTGVSGVTQSFTTNRISGNTAPGSVPTAIGAPTTATGQQ